MERYQHVFPPSIHEGHLSLCLSCQLPPRLVLLVCRHSGVSYAKSGTAAQGVISWQVTLVTCVCRVLEQSGCKTFAGLTAPSHWLLLSV